MTLLHQAAQKAVEALTDILGVEVMAPEGGREEVQEIHCIARTVLASLESALQQQPEPVATVTVETLRQHWLHAMECDHAAGRDKPHCACSLVDLGWHPSVGAAVEAWLAHVSGVSPALQHQEVPREPVAWIPYLADRADGVRGHYAISRWNPGTRGHGYRETWNLRSHKWTTCSDEVLTLDQANELLRGLTIPSAPTAIQQEELSGERLDAIASEHWKDISGPDCFQPSEFDFDHRAFARAVLAAASPSTTRQQEVGSGYEQTLAGLLKRCARCLPPEHATRKLATEYLRDNGYMSPLRAAAPSTPEKAGGAHGTPAPLPDEAFVGWKLVPIMPTKAMLDAADHKFQVARYSLAGFNARELAYKALLDAAPPFGVPSPIPHPLPAQPNDGGEHG